MFNINAITLHPFSTKIWIYSSFDAIFIFWGWGNILLISSSSAAYLSSICSLSLFAAARLSLLRASFCLFSSPAERISSAKVYILASAFSFPRSSHSHTTITVHPNASKWAAVTSSLCLFLAIFVSQNSTLDLGFVAYRYPLCPCPKSVNYKGNLIFGKHAIRLSRQRLVQKSGL